MHECMYTCMQVSDRFLLLNGTVVVNLDLYLLLLTKYTIDSVSMLRIVCTLLHGSMWLMVWLCFFSWWMEA